MLKLKLLSSFETSPRAMTSILILPPSFDVLFASDQSITVSAKRSYCHSLFCLCYKRINDECHHCRYRLYKAQFACFHHFLLLLYAAIMAAKASAVLSIAAYVPSDMLFALVFSSGANVLSTAAALLLRPVIPNCVSHEPLALDKCNQGQHAKIWHPELYLYEPCKICKVCFSLMSLYLIDDTPPRPYR